MYKSISEAQRAEIKNIDGINTDISEYSPQSFETELEKFFAVKGQAFQLVIAEMIRKKMLTASGELESNISFDVYEKGAGMEVRMLDYYDFVNKGVKGIKSSRNAPQSPYKYKNYGMSLEGRQNIKKYIESGKAKIETVQKDKARGIGQERKGVSLIDAKVETLVYLIKKYGIKKTNYFDDAIKIVMKDFNKQIAQTMGRTISMEITR